MFFELNSPHHIKKHCRQILTYTSSTTAVIFYYFIISFTELIETFEGNQKPTVCYRNYSCLDPGVNCLYDA